MRTQILITLSLVVLSSPGTFAQNTVPRPATPEQDSLFRVAIGLYDKGAYDQAISIYSSILQQNPDFVEAIAELSMTYTAAQKYESAVGTALRGLQYISRHRPYLYLNLGNAYDMLDKPDDAIAAYHNGLSLEPKSYLLHFNLGLTFMRTGKLDSSRFHFQLALKGNPSHASSNLALANVYRSLGKRIPAILAYSRFLILEPNSRRSASAAAILHSLLSDSMSVRSAGADQMTISLSPDSDAIDGDLMPLEVALATTQGVRLTKDTTYDSPLASIASDLSTLFQITSELLDAKSADGFIWNYYAPYFASLQKQGYTDLATRLIFRSTDKTEVLDFLRSRLARVQEFKEWTSAYDWGQ